jgi:hypothetical protein
MVATAHRVDLRSLISNPELNALMLLGGVDVVTPGDQAARAPKPVASRQGGAYCLSAAAVEVLTVDRWVRKGGSCKAGLMGSRMPCTLLNQQGCLLRWSSTHRPGRCCCWAIAAAAVTAGSNHRAHRSPTADLPVMIGCGSVGQGCSHAAVISLTHLSYAITGLSYLASSSLVLTHPSQLDCRLAAQAHHAVGWD